MTCEASKLQTFRKHNAIVYLSKMKQMPDLNCNFAFTAQLHNRPPAACPPAAAVAVGTVGSPRSSSHISRPVSSAKQAAASAPTRVPRTPQNLAVPPAVPSFTSAITGAGTGTGPSRGGTGKFSPRSWGGASVGGSAGAAGATGEGAASFGPGTGRAATAGAKDGGGDIRVFTHGNIWAKARLLLWCSRSMARGSSLNLFERYVCEVCRRDRKVRLTALLVELK